MCLSPSPSPGSKFHRTLYRARITTRLAFTCGPRIRSLSHGQLSGFWAQHTGLKLSDPFQIRVQPIASPMRSRGVLVLGILNGLLFASLLSRWVIGRHFRCQWCQFGGCKSTNGRYCAIYLVPKICHNVPVAVGIAPAELGCQLGHALSNATPDGFRSAQFCSNHYSLGI
jgi:hypothetical protein